MTRILAIDTSTAWCSVALSLGDQAPILRHELVSAGASQLLLPWVDSLLQQAHLKLSDLNAIAVGIGPGAFTGVRLGVAAVQGLAISCDLPILPVSSLDAIAAQLVKENSFKQVKPKYFAIAIDARMDEIYWAKFESSTEMNGLAKRIGDIYLSKPEELDLVGIEFLAGSAINAYGDRLFGKTKTPLPINALDAAVHLTAGGILDCARNDWADGRQINVRALEPLYVRDKVALTTQERLEAFK
ncbi:tRNA (adenosine(37)-N6)-threonylcarbamoyltransferase complex dimerization subunit type 1 TsaB [Polynucleobacter hirudinilacicola]|uniref:tRNA (Adenosine(37)-N6)-threonylcarbamoyltransferase complex dimerization subunit type 1 TsaB n=1 Tax=Polynucleobacter hirudinilacicola TaxID=1743166 RepID=A0A210RXQ6_9BURK|nr:tRNA (adenosine(37)-N6)-threonylcarbamoyltransferase complex dimerization subunit type 1 TsaB [Polynucleobacter hirudinilacicola]OWF65707.1 tRNA (adenosine(37)-N6)-threonylcarbamoyltransferase complex dimerization subunit type 1 TsaB [Polynucleobacter hirudinilacicola]